MRQPPRLLQLTVHLMPGAFMRGKEWQDIISVEVCETASAGDVKECLSRLGCDWGPLATPCWGAIHELHNAGVLERCRMLHKGMPLKLEASLKEQGVTNGGVLRLLRPSSAPWRALESPPNALPIPSIAAVPKRFPRRAISPLAFGQLPEGASRCRTR